MNSDFITLPTRRPELWSHTLLDYQAPETALEWANIKIVHREDCMRQWLTAWLRFTASLAIGFLAVSLLVFGQTAFAQGAFDGHVKVGVLNDQSSLYAD